ncbi:YdjY domain-containing protein [Urbifossiella limnaea]|uniref:Uncharacterized protein n=1 Tax=Urbifossiella limnaea TaxID=2528023 RepID=A0A517XL40_9BACT|nr:YdjY domain-containing protein [Urbifossiella limnaea]QDU18231.1 hypothetical protein ETAA1_01140 [Urbifossiella limnaea]
MTRTLLTLAAVAGLTAAPALAPWPAAAQPPAANPDPRAKDAEPLPPYPKADPGSKVIEDPKLKGLVIELLPNGTRRVGFVAEVCLREGPLEVFLCKQGTKEHEAVLRADFDAGKIHELLLLAGATPGTPAQFVDPKTNEPKFKAATGTAVKILLTYQKDKKVHTHPAQEWVWNSAKKRTLETAHWVFAGSQLLKNPDRPEAPPFYAANSGEVIALSNFAYSMLEVPMEISKDDAQLNYEAKTDRIPPLFSRVWVVLEPAAAPKK